MGEVFTRGDVSFIVSTISENLLLRISQSLSKSLELKETQCVEQRNSESHRSLLAKHERLAFHFPHLHPTGSAASRGFPWFASIRIGSKKKAMVNSEAVRSGSVPRRIVSRPVLGAGAVPFSSVPFNI